MVRAVGADSVMSTLLFATSSAALNTTLLPWIKLMRLRVAISVPARATSTFCVVESSFTDSVRSLARSPPPARPVPVMICRVEGTIVPSARILRLPSSLCSTCRKSLRIFPHASLSPPGVGNLLSITYFSYVIYLVYGCPSHYATLILKKPASDHANSVSKISRDVWRTFR